MPQIITVSVDDLLEVRAAAAFWLDDRPHDPKATGLKLALARISAEMNRPGTIALLAVELGDGNGNTIGG